MRTMDEQLPHIQELWDAEISKDVHSKLRSAPRGSKVDKQSYLQDVEGAYHAIGGYARLAYEASQDPKWFFNRFFPRLLPDEKQELDVTVHIHPAIPRSALDGEFVEVPSDETVGHIPSSPSGHSGRAIGSGGGSGAEEYSHSEVPTGWSRDDLGQHEPPDETT